MYLCCYNIVIYFLNSSATAAALILHCSINSATIFLDLACNIKTVLILSNHHHYHSQLVTTGLRHPWLGHAGSYFNRFFHVTLLCIYLFSSRSNELSWYLATVHNFSLQLHKQLSIALLYAIISLIFQHFLFVCVRFNNYVQLLFILTNLIFICNLYIFFLLNIGS